MNGVPVLPDADLRRELRQVAALSAARATDLARAVEELEAMRRRATAFSDQLDLALVRITTLERACAAESRQAAQLRAELAAARDRSDEAHLLRQSTSWRVTRPLRALRRPLRTLRYLLGRPV